MEIKKIESIDDIVLDKEIINKYCKLELKINDNIKFIDINDNNNIIEIGKNSKFENLYKRINDCNLINENLKQRMIHYNNYSKILKMIPVKCCNFNNFYGFCTIHFKNNIFCKIQLYIGLGFKNIPNNESQCEILNNLFNTEMNKIYNKKNINNIYYMNNFKNIAIEPVFIKNRSNDFYVNIYYL